MTATLTHRGLDVILPEIEKATLRRDNLIIRSDEISSQLSELREKHSRSIADEDKVDQTIPSQIRELSEEQAATTHAITLLEQQLVSLSQEKKRAEIGRAGVVLQLKTNLARDLAQDLHKKIDEFANDQLIPVANRLLFAIKEAKAAEHVYDQVAGNPREPWQSDVENSIVHPAQKSITVSKILRAYAEGKALPMGDPSGR